jgi:hypothetical protein
MAWWYVHYQHDKNYEFGKLKNLFLKKAIDRKIHPAIIGIATLPFMGFLVILLNNVLRLLQYRQEILFIPILVLGTWGCIRDMNPIKRREHHKLIWWLKLLLSVSVGISWFYIPSWYSYNLAAFIVVINLMRALSPLKFEYLLYILGAIVIYDIWGVFFSKEIVKVVAETTAVSMRIPPVVVLIPNSGSMIGIGDIVLPGLVFVTAIRSQVALFTIVGYGVGLIAAFTAANYVAGYLPAMVFLAPTTVGAAWFGRRIKNKTGVPW